LTVAFPLDPLPAVVEVRIGGTVGWVDITDDVRLSSAASGGGIEITRGISPEANRADPGKVALTIANGSGRYSPRNPNGEWYGLFGRNTPIRIGVTLASDDYGRTVSGGWGSTPDGRAWGVFGAAAADFSVSSGMGRHAHPTKNIVRGTYLDRDWQDVEQVSLISTSAVSTGASVVTGHIARNQIASGNRYWFRLEFDTAGKISVKISKTISGTITELAVSSAIAGLSYSAGQAYWLRSSVCGSRLKLKIWASGQVEPTAWTLAVTDTSIATPGRAGFASWAVGGNTNTGLEVRHDSYAAIDRRFFGEVTKWPVRWDLGGFDRWVPIEAYGLLRRLNQGTQVEQSPMRRSYGASNPVAYWPMEDGSSSAQAASAIPGHPPAVTSGTVSFADVADFSWGTGDLQTVRYGTGRILDFKDGGSLTATMPGDVTAATASAWTVTVAALPLYSAATGAVTILDIACSGGTVSRVRLIQQAAPSTGYDIVVTNNGVDSTVLSSGSANISFVTYFIGLWQTGGTVNVGYSWKNDGTGYNFFTTMSGTLGGITSIAVNPSQNAFSGDSMPYGHLAVWASGDPPAGATWGTEPDGTHRYGPLYSWWQERILTRMARLAAEEGIPLSVAPSRGSTAIAGWQRPGAFLALMTECAEADGGLLYEEREDLALTYRPLRSLYSQTPLTLSYTGGHITDPFEPVDDDDAILNDITVSRKDGSSARAIQRTGPLAALPAPQGVGVYDASIDLNVGTDAQLPDLASWRLHLGTVDEARYPTISADLSSTAWAADPVKTSQATAVDSGDVLSLADLPAWLPAGSIDTLALARGYSETLDAFDWDITWNASPGSPYRVGLADQVGRIGATGAKLAAAISSSQLSFTVTTPAASGPWTTNPANFPFDIRIGGEKATVTGISGTGATQTFTLSARGVNGVQRSWPVDTEVQVWNLAYVGL
jgi:hypothetical protein